MHANAIFLSPSDFLEPNLSDCYRVSGAVLIAPVDPWPGGGCRYRVPGRTPKLWEARSWLYRRRCFANQYVLVGKLVTRSTRCTYVCTAQTSKLQQNSRHNFGKIEYTKIQFIRIFAIWHYTFTTAILVIPLNLKLMKFYRNFTDVCENVKIRWELQTNGKRNVKIPWNFRIWWQYFFVPNE